MGIPKLLIKSMLLIPVLAFVIIYLIVINKAEAIAPLDSERQIYEVTISENTQRDIWKLCEENGLSYALVLSVYQVDGINDSQIDDTKNDIDNLLYYRDYWTVRGYSDEMVFDLMLISRERGIDGCIAFMKERVSYSQDVYVQKVTEFKYNLEQNLNVASSISSLQDIGPSLTMD